MKSCTFAGDNDEYVVSGSNDFNLYVWRAGGIDCKYFTYKRAEKKSKLFFELQTIKIINGLIGIIWFSMAIDLLSIRCDTIDKNA